MSSHRCGLCGAETVPDDRARIGVTYWEARQLVQTLSDGWPDHLDAAVLSRITAACQDAERSQILSLTYREALQLTAALSWAQWGWPLDGNRDGLDRIGRQKAELLDRIMAAGEDLEVSA